MMNVEGAPLFSIITVCLNDKEGLIRTQKSIMQQKIINYEWIIIDGASNDGTKEYIENLSIFRCNWISEPDKGLYDAMNKGIDLATGEYLIFLNSGDEFAGREVLLNVSKVFSKGTKPDFIYGDSFERRLDRSLNYKPARSHTHLWYGMFTHHQAMLYKRSIVGSTRYSLSYAIGADYAFTACMLNGVRSSLYLPMPICIFEHGGLSEINTIIGEKDQFLIRKEILQYSAISCIAIQILHVIVRIAKRIAPQFYRSFRYDKKADFR